MAMGGRGQREATSAISACRPFSNSTRSLRGTRGPVRNRNNLGWLEYGFPPRYREQARELLSRATYVVWSYDTPIGFVSEDEDGERTAYYIDESHSTTTSHHQTLVRVGFGDFETIGEGPCSRSMPRRRRAEEANRRVRELAEAARRDPSDRFRTNHRGVRYDSLVERDTSFERDMVEARNTPLPSPATEHAPQSTLEYLLDRRLSNPDWVPGRDIEADYAAERRDAARVEREQAEKGFRL